MDFLNIKMDIKNVPELDETFIPLGKFFLEYLKGATKPLSIAIERNDGLTSVFETRIYGTENMEATDNFFVERLIKFLLWAKGGFKVVICGDKKMFEYIRDVYSITGKRSFDFCFMEKVYEQSFEVVYAEYLDCPAEVESPKEIGGNFTGCRIGFDAGGSDRKVSAVIDGNPVYSEEVVWFPKLNEDPAYHFDQIISAFKTASSKMPRVDAIGVSSAGIFINNRAMVASLFIKVPEEKFNSQVKDIYINAARAIGDIPLNVVNDGDVSALTGAMSSDESGILGIAMGTSEAVGYVNKHGKITGWLNELAFAPVDCQNSAPVDEWSGDIGCGVKYFSQDAVIRLAEKAGIQFDQKLSLAEKLAKVQEMLANEIDGIESIYQTIGIYLGHSLALYNLFYDINMVMILGRVTSGKGGDIILSEAKRVMKEEYQEIYRTLTVYIPDEQTRRIGQSVAAASL